MKAPLGITFETAREVAWELWFKGHLKFNKSDDAAHIILSVVNKHSALPTTQTPQANESRTQTVLAWRDLEPDEWPTLGDRFYDPDKRAWHIDELPPDGKCASWPGWITPTWQRRVSPTTQVAAGPKGVEDTDRATWIKTSDRPPTTEDADIWGNVFVLEDEPGREGVDVTSFENAVIDQWPYWMPIPPLPAPEQPKE